LIKAKNIHLQYLSNKKPTFHDVSFEINKGDFVILSGPSGSGKTSLLKLMHMNLQPTHGRLEIFGQAPYKMSNEQKSRTRQKMGFIFQDLQLLDDSTVFENVALPLKITSKGKNHIDKNVTELLDWFELSHRKKDKISNLSGGEKQQIAIARAIINKPQLILADEPTESIDIQTGDKILKLLQEMNKFGTTVVLATHSQRIKDKINGKSFSLFDGKIIQEQVSNGS